MNLFAIITFFLLLYAGMVLCSLIQSMIRSIICAFFLLRFLTLQNYTRLAPLVFYVYLTTLLAFNCFLAVDIFLDKGIACDGKTDWQIFTLILVDTGQTAMLITVAALMYR